eukprot:6198907-Pleurochrysis_carterae.AAC.1
MVAVEDGRLPKSDTKTSDSLSAHYSTEQQYFRAYMQLCQAAKQSGASADDLDAIKTRPATQIFIENDYHNIPMSIASWTVDGDSAKMGGVGNLCAHDFLQQPKRRCPNPSPASLPDETLGSRCRSRQDVHCDEAAAFTPSASASSCSSSEPNSIASSRPSSFSHPLDPSHT